MKTRTCFIGLVVSVIFLLMQGSFVFAEDSGLVGQLVKSLGVTAQQAEGGAGAIFDVAKQKMGGEDFSKVLTAMPEVNSLLGAAPKNEKNAGGIGGLSSMLTENTGSLGKMAGLYSSFSKLGLGKDMVSKFIPPILEYAKSKGGDVISNLLKSALE